MTCSFRLTGSKCALASGVVDFWMRSGLMASRLISPTIVLRKLQI